MTMNDPCLPWSHELSCEREGARDRSLIILALSSVGFFRRNGRKTKCKKNRKRNNRRRPGEKKKNRKNKNKNDCTLRKKKKKREIG